MPATGHHLHAPGEETSIRIDPKPQRSAADERHVVALPFPGGGFGERCDQFVIELRLGRRTGAVLDLAGDEDHAVAGDRELSLAALAPELEHDLAVVTDVEVGDALGAGLARGIERHFHAERKAVGGLNAVHDGKADKRDRHKHGNATNEFERNHAAPRKTTAALFYWTHIALNRFGSEKNGTENAPRRLDRGDSTCLRSGPLFYHHHRERIDIGLQGDQHADEARQHDRVQEDVAQDRALVAVPVGGGGGHHDRLG